MNRKEAEKLITETLEKGGFPPPEIGEQPAEVYKKILDYIWYLEKMVQAGGL